MPPECEREKGEVRAQWRGEGEEEGVGEREGKKEGRGRARACWRVESEGERWRRNPSASEASQSQQNEEGGQM